MDSLWIYELRHIAQQIGTSQRVLTQLDGRCNRESDSKEMCCCQCYQYKMIQSARVDHQMPHMHDHAKTKIDFDCA